MNCKYFGICASCTLFDKTYEEQLNYKIQREKEKKGLLLIYALDERGTPNVNNGIPIIGYSLHFPKIENEVKTSYTTTIYDGFEDEMQEDDDLPNNDNE